MFDPFSDYLIEVLFVLALAGTLIVIAGLHAPKESVTGAWGRRAR